MANKVTVGLSLAGFGSMGCLVGVGGHVSTMLQNAKAANRIIMIDGCGVKCGKKALDHAGISDFMSVVITDLGIKKTYDLLGDQDKAEQIMEQILSKASNIVPQKIEKEPIPVQNCCNNGRCSDEQRT